MVRKKSQDKDMFQGVGEKLEELAKKTAKNAEKIVKGAEKAWEKPDVDKSAHEIRMGMKRAGRRIKRAANRK